MLRPDTGRLLNQFPSSPTHADNPENNASMQKKGGGDSENRAGSPGQPSQAGRRPTVLR